MDYSLLGSLSTEFSRKEYWSGLPFPPIGDLPDPGIKLSLLNCRLILHLLSHRGSPTSLCCHLVIPMKLKDALLRGRKVMTNLDSIFKSRDITLPTKVRLVKAMVFQWSCMDVRVGL